MRHKGFRTWAIWLALIAMGGCIGPEVEATRALNHGNEALQAKNYSAAVTLYTEALRLNPSVRGPRENLAILALRTERVADALKFAAQATVAFPEDASPRLVYGWACLKAGRLPCVWESLERLKRHKLSPSQAQQAKRLRLWAKVAAGTVEASDSLPSESDLATWILARGERWAEIRPPGGAIPRSRGIRRELSLHAALHQGESTGIVGSLTEQDDALLGLFLRFRAGEFVQRPDEMTPFEALNFDKPREVAMARLWCALWADSGLWGQVVSGLERLEAEGPGDQSWVPYGLALAHAHLGDLERAKATLIAGIESFGPRPEATALLDLLEGR